MSDDASVMPPALESIDSHNNASISIVSNNNNMNNLNNIKSMKNKAKINNENNKNRANSHKNAVENVMEELAKEHIDRTVLKPSSNFNGRPCLNMKDFFKLMNDKNKRQQNLDALYNLVENDSDSVIGFVELNGLSFIDEWLDVARKENNYWFSLCILQFLCHNNLCITYQALQTVSIVKAVKQFININPSSNNSSTPRLTDKIKNLLPSDLNISRANDNFIQKIDRNAIHNVCYENKNIDAIRYLQSQFASRIVNKWKKFVADWKKHKLSFLLFVYNFILIAILRQVRI